jgi:hypothetical protein
MSPGIFIQHVIQLNCDHKWAKKSFRPGGNTDLCLTLRSAFITPIGQIKCQGRRSGENLKTAVICGSKACSARAAIAVAHTEDSRHLWL